MRDKIFDFLLKQNLNNFNSILDIDFSSKN